VVIPGNYVLGKILLGWSSAFYRSWLRSARSLMTVRYGGAPSFRGEGKREGSSGTRIHRFRWGALYSRRRNSRKLVRLCSTCSFCPDKSGRDAWTTPRDYSLIVKIVSRVREHKDLISLGTKYLGIYDRHTIHPRYIIHPRYSILARSAVVNLWAREHLHVRDVFAYVKARLL